MFQGTIPTEALTQLRHVVPLDTWHGIQVACSGSFKFEAFFRQHYPDLPLIGNDVSLFSCSLGELAAGRELAFRFVERLAFVEDVLGPRASYARRVAAVQVAADMTAYRGDNVWARRHFAWYQAHFSDYLDQVEQRLVERVVPLRLQDFILGDWVAAMRAAVAQGYGVVSFPPVYKRGYEKLYKWLDANTEWQAPAYAEYDPKTLVNHLHWLTEQGADWCIVSEQDLPEIPRFGKLQKGRALPYYLYGQSRHSTLRVLGHHSSASFRYQTIDLARLGPATRVKVGRCDGKAIMHLKDIYLAKNIIHAAGRFEFVVFLDDMLLGVLSFAKSKVDYFGLKTLYLQSDVCTTSEGRLSKLLCQLARSGETLAPVDRIMFERHQYVVTTAFSRHPVSMKYRGVFELVKRTPAEGGFQLQYGNQVSDLSHQQCYAWWWEKYGCQTPS